MDLLPSDLRAEFALYPIGSQEGRGDNALVIVKFFFPAGRYTFYATEGEPRDNDFLFFGYCISPLGADCDEWGYVTLSELASVKAHALTMERDLHFPIAERTVAEARRRAA